MNSYLLANMDPSSEENGSTTLPLPIASSSSTATSSSSIIHSVPSIVVNSSSFTHPVNTSSNIRACDGISYSSEDDLREWTRTYHMRTLNLLNFPTNASSNRVSYRTVMNRARIGIVTGAAKSLNVLRQVLQNSINNEINSILQKYIERYFRPSITNIKKNFGTNSVSEQHLQAACRQILEEAKKMYVGSNLNGNACSPLNGELMENGSDYENNMTVPISKKRQHGDKRHAHPQIASLLDCESDSESNSQHLRPPPMKRKKLKGSATVGKARSGFSNKLQFKSGNAFDIRREGHRWESSRLTTDTKFVLGSKANKALGFGATRGRLYTKHADLFRYIGDAEDKQWLHEHGLMPPAGGKAYLIIKEDIEDLLNSDEYRDAPGVDGSSMGSGFTVPEKMINKMRRTMDAMRNESAMIRSLNEGRKPAIPHVALESERISENCDVSSDVASNNSNPGLVDFEVEGESREPSPTAVDLDYLNPTVGEVTPTNGSPFSSIMPTDLSPNPELLISQLPTDLSLN